jgi:hypothetical protein
MTERRNKKKEWMQKEGEEERERERKYKKGMEERIKEAWDK